MSYALQPDGSARYVADSPLPGSTTGLRLGPSGPVATTMEQVAELHRLAAAGFSLHAVVSSADVADTSLSPTEIGQHDLSLELQRLTVARQLDADHADAKLHHNLQVMQGMQEIDAAVKADDDRRPRSFDEQENRVRAAVQAAAQLGYVLAVVPGQAVQVQGLTGPFQRQVFVLIANAGNVLAERVEYGPDELHNIEARLDADMREHRRRVAREAMEAAHPAELPVVRVITEDQAHAESPAGRLEAERSELAALKAQVQQLLAGRTAD